MKEMLFQLPADARNLIWYYTKMDHVRMMYKGVNQEFRDQRHTYLMILIAQKLKCTSGVYLHQNFMACTNKLFLKYTKTNPINRHAYSQLDVPDFGNRVWLLLFVARECVKYMVERGQQPRTISIHGGKCLSSAHFAGDLSAEAEQTE